MNLALRHRFTASQLALLLSALLAVPSAHAAAKQMQARIAKINDGDTITVIDMAQKRHIVQLDGIDAPELGQPYGEASKKHLERRLTRKNVVVIWNKTTGEGAKLGKVLLNNGDINQLQVRTGSAWATGEISVNFSGSDKARYAAAQNVAKEKSLGLWRAGNAVAPWDWRKQNQAKSAAATAAEQEAKGIKDDDPPPDNTPVETHVMPQKE
jgi:endonuclease YncB( thermonuclease family)